MARFLDPGLEIEVETGDGQTPISHKQSLTVSVISGVHLIIE